MIPRIKISSEASKDLSLNLIRLQFPIRLAYAMTINKAQGQSLMHVGINIQDEVFSHGQLYVAMSRATSATRMKVLLPTSMSGTEGMCKNIVFSEVFQ